MLDQKDLEAIGALLERTENNLRTEFQKGMQGLRAELREEMQQSEQRMKWFTELKIKESEALLLEDADWTRSDLSARIDTLDKKVEEIQEYYRIRKLNDDTSALLTKRMDRLEERVARLEA